MFNRIEIQALLSLSLRYALVFFALFKFCPNLSWMLEEAFSGASDLNLVGFLLVLIMCDRETPGICRLCFLGVATFGLCTFLIIWISHEQSKTG